MEWSECVADAATEACEEAFGAGGWSRRSENTEARDLIRLVVEMVGYLNTSADAQDVLGRVEVRKPRAVGVFVRVPWGRSQH